MFNWNAFFNYYNSATKNRNISKEYLMRQGFDNAWNQYWQKYCHGIGTLFIQDVFYGKGLTEYCKMAKTQMMSLGLTSALADSVIKQLKNYIKNTK